MILALSPYMMNIPRSSSPLNPNLNTSSDPLSSPTPSSSRNYQSFSLHSNKNSSPSVPLLSTRYIRPSSSSKKSSSSSSSRRASSSNETNSDLFSEGTTPTEGLMWREKFTRRLEERERRKKSRELNLDKKRGLQQKREFNLEEEEEADRKAQQDDEEIFRRLVILQRKKNQHATLQSHELETGGSDPLLPDLEDELLQLEKEEKELINRLDQIQEIDHNHNLYSSPIPVKQNFKFNSHHQNIIEDDKYEEEWEKEAALAEEQERDQEDIILVEQAELQQFAQIRHSQNHNSMDIDMDLDEQVDWEAFDSMDIEQCQ
ncbi:uncharacterized protein I206_101892 [Kwoniella pini CBS 10737]|uniref:Uncharacterized protein n=1 Tax=Kwoniella pini CBS 10737 TaxID=1296096 RepID=A0A1B9HVF2_9TREE|nr:uncharacterized protein I206_07017 [Kwoniella pini CBS 10737]OCF47239.1 hypothetical protein I206_07017 [Kwoniella pini CBS 10737]